MLNTLRKNVAHFTSKNIKIIIIRIFKQAQFLFLMSVLLVSGISYYSFSSKINNSDKEYSAMILQERKDKDDFFKYDKSSPLTDAMKKKFKGLKYYPPDLSFKFKAKLIPFSKKDTVNILTTKNDVRKMIRYGKFEFVYKKQTYHLTAFLPTKTVDEDYFFVPFKDLTNSNETYSGGRYLDIEKNDRSDEYDLDFNLAYNPYCVYNLKFSCPLVPEQNHLKISIKAGEKIYKSK